MSLLSSLLHDARHLRQTLIDVLVLQCLIEERMFTMSVKGDELKAQIAAIAANVTEIDGDLDEVLAKISAITGLPTDEEWSDISGLLEDLKTKTSTVAGKVPEPSTSSDSADSSGS